MAKVSPLMLLPPAIFAGLAAIFVWGMSREDPDALPSALKGREAPAVVVTPIGDLPVFDRIEDPLLRFFFEDSLFVRRL